jgi:hypothetical protein
MPDWRRGFSRIVNSERGRRWLPLVVLAGAGALLSCLPMASRGGRSVVAALVADWSWLKTDLAWETRDETRTRTWSTVALRAAPGVDYFRLNAARMRAFDFPAWRETREPAAPAAVRARWRAELGEEAIALVLEDGERDAGRLIEAGNLALYALGDAARAAEFYRRAAELPGAPWHAGRIYAELLCRTGRAREALAWLKAWLPRLPADDPAAQRELVAVRIAELERSVGSTGEAL